MEDNKSAPPESQENPPIPVRDEMPVEDSRKKWLIIAVVVAVLLVIIGGAIFLMTRNPAVTSQIRDVFIIFMALESLVIGVALVILIVQVAVLTNLLQNEIKPILNSTSETVNTLRGTVIFLSDNISEPVIKLNEYLAGIKKLFEIVRPPKRSG